MATAARSTDEDEQGAEITDLAAAREAAGWPEGEEAGGDEESRRSARDRADESDVLGTDEEPDEELFVLEHEKQVTLSTLFKRNVAVEYRLNVSAKSLKGSGDMGLVSFHQPDMLLLVPTRAGKVSIDPTYDADGNVEKVTIIAIQKPITAYDARGAAAKDLLRGIDGITVDDDEPEAA